MINAVELAAQLDDVLIEYVQSNGTRELRSRIATLYPGATADDIVVGNGSAEANFVIAWDLVRPAICKRIRLTNLL